MPCGPWRSVRLESFRARVSNLRVDYEVLPGFKDVTGHITAFVEGSFGRKVVLSIALHNNRVFEETVNIGHDGTAKAEFRISHVELWYPHGYGQQPLYTCTATIRSGKSDVVHTANIQTGTDGIYTATISTDEVDLHTLSQKTGFRLSELIQQPDHVGKTFFFRVNGIDVFCGGSDWIPGDSFTPRITKEKYKKWLQALVDGFQVMIR